MIFYRKTAFSLSRLGVAIGLACLVGTPALAATLEPGESATVGPGDAPEIWFLRPGAHLTINPGGRSEDIFAMNGSRVEITGAEVIPAGSMAGISLVNSSALIRDSWISAESYGLSVSSTWLNDGGPSSAEVDNSIIVSDKIAASIDSGTLHASDSIFWGESIGIEMADGKLSLTHGSEVSGDVGIDLQAAYFFADTMGNEVLIDASSVEGRNGSAIRIQADNFGEPTHAEIVLRNGATLKASNGLLIDAEKGADVGVSVANSHLTGQLLNVDRLSLTEGASWTMTANAEVGALHLIQGTVAFGSAPGAFHTLALDSLAGDGQFNMNVDLAAREGDLLKIAGQAIGSFDLKIANTGLEPQAGGGPLTVVETGGGDGHFAVLGGQVDAGAYAYELQREGDDWALMQKLDRHGRAIQSASTQSVLGLYNAAPVVWNSELAGLRSRFDELRREPGSKGLWLRSQGARYSVQQGASPSYDLRQRGLTLGFDATLNEQLTVGLLAGTSSSDLDFSRGTRGSIDSAYLGAYAGWAGADGLYVDALIKASRFSNRADVMMSDGVKARGKYHDLGLGASVELGKHMQLGDGWYVKPYGQLTALSIQGQDYQLSNGLQASNNGAMSMTGKLGSQLGRTLAMAGGGTLQPYVKVAASREFANGNQARVNGQTFDNSLAGNSLELGTGFAAQLSPAWQLNAEFDYARGQRVDQAYGVSAGLRYAF